MKTFYITSDKSAIIIDNERNEAKDPKSVFPNIRNLYVAEEPLEIRSSIKNGKQIVTKADTGDIILTFYGNTPDNAPIVIKNAEWKKRVHAQIARIAAEKEKMRVEANLSDCCDCCENCRCFD